MVNVLVTGGAGFIGSNFIRYALEAHPNWHITTLDKLTYAGRRENLNDFLENPRYHFVHGDIADSSVSGPLVKNSQIIINFAAETHVDRAINDAGIFINTDIYGTFILLEAARSAENLKCFVQVSTDEVYGNVPTGTSKETDELRPRNPYSASKAGADRLAYSYWATYDIPILITRASNNYGPRQFPEKLIPLFISNAIDNLPLPLYGDGHQIRDWLHVLDHCHAIDFLLEHGEPGQVYNIGGNNEIENGTLTKCILEILDRPLSLLRHIEDRPGHDRRYNLDTNKLQKLGWSPQINLTDGLPNVVEWYSNNQSWWRNIKDDPIFRAYYKKQYGNLG